MPRIVEERLDEGRRSNDRPNQTPNRDRANEIVVSGSFSHPKNVHLSRFLRQELGCRIDPIKSFYPPHMSTFNVIMWSREEADDVVAGSPYQYQGSQIEVELSELARYEREEAAAAAARRESENQRRSNGDRRGGYRGGNGGYSDGYSRTSHAGTPRRRGNMHPSARSGEREGDVPEAEAREQYRNNRGASRGSRGGRGGRRPQASWGGSRRETDNQEYTDEPDTNTAGAFESKDGEPAAPTDSVDSAYATFKKSFLKEKEQLEAKYQSRVKSVQQVMTDLDKQRSEQLTLKEACEKEVESAKRKLAEVDNTLHAISVQKNELVADFDQLSEKHSSELVEMEKTMRLLQKEEGAKGGATSDSVDPEMLEHLLRDELECFCCFNFMTGRVIQCSAGHVICYDCRRKLDECPVCREKYAAGTIRNLLAEKLASCIKFE